IGFSGLVSGQADEIDGEGGKVGRRIAEGVLRPDIPEGSPGGTVFAQVGATAAGPKTASFSRIQIGEEILVGGALVMIETEVDTFTIGKHVPGTMTDRN